MKALLICFCVSGWSLGSVLFPHNEDFLTMKTNMVIYADGTPKEILDEKQPMISSWRQNIMEIRNMCKLAQCNFQFLRVNAQPNRFVSTKCYLVNSGTECESPVEKNALFTLEEIFHQADYATSLTLGGQRFGYVGSCKTEDGLVVMEIDPANLVVEDPGDALNKKLKA